MTDIPSDSKRLTDLAAAYDFDALERDKRELGWRAGLLERWCAGLRPGASVLELGAGTGQAAQHVADQGCAVTALDLSPRNVAMCRQRGVTAFVADMGNIAAIDDPAFAPPFDAAFAINSLIHFPKAKLAPALTSIRSALRPGSDLMFTLWGGRSSEGHWEEDWTQPIRFFSFYAEQEARQMFEGGFPGYDGKSFSTLDNRDELGLYSLVIELTAS